MLSPDLPPAEAPMSVEAHLARWPTGAWKTELIRGVIYAYARGQFDERDIATAERAFPGRRGLINANGDLEVHPAGTSPLESILDGDPSE
ncbi:hypothetical protein [Streptomyces sp. N35]|uniref:hypothetical protein n=1 Tax=Streptomyces sp. N35 TaxID=2795730 RepID=UPI0018F6DFF8|nr:hypothetical protein [Streptomyces sp. N35]